MEGIHNTIYYLYKLYNITSPSPNVDTVELFTNNVCSKLKYDLTHNKEEQNKAVNEIIKDALRKKYYFSNPVLTPQNLAFQTKQLR